MIPTSELMGGSLSAWILLRNDGVPHGIVYAMRDNRTLVAPTYRRYTNPATERVRAAAIAEAVDIVRRGLAPLAGRDSTAEVFADMRRPERPR